MKPMTDFKPDKLNSVPIPYKDSVADLQNQVKSPSPSAWTAIRALAGKNEPEALMILVGLTASSDWRFRRSAVESIGISINGHNASNIVYRLLDDPVGYVVRSAIEAASNLRLTNTHDKILSLASDPNDSTKLASLRALEKLWKPSDFEFVFNRYLHDGSDRVRKQAAFAIHANISEEFWRRVFSIWSMDFVPRHRIWACELLGKFGKKNDVPLLQPLLIDPNGHVRRAANKASEHIIEVQT